MEEKEGRIAEVRFHNEENGYSVIIFETEEEQFTAVGALPSCNKGSSYRLSGNFEMHPVYGEQFRFTNFSEITPSTISGITDFLASGIIRGVGPKTAVQITEMFGEDTLEVMEKTPERLLEISGIGSKKLEQIKESYESHRKFTETAMFLQSFDIGTDYAMKLYKVYKDDVIEILRENPYRLVDDVYGIGFRKADKIALKLGISEDDDYRIRSGIKYVLSCYAAEGHTFVPEKEMCDKTCELLDTGSEKIRDNIFELALDGDIKVENIDNREVIYPFRLYRAEKNVSSSLINLSSAEVKAINTSIEAVTDMAESEAGIILSDKQRYAVISSVSEGVSVITGGPGTGKTTIINIIIRILERAGYSVAIAAPTGRAAKRITETSGYDASTIHRLLEYSYGEDETNMTFGRNEENPLEFDAVIVDEASMIDLILMDALLRAVKPGTRLIIAGDADQLPSVGAGNVLRDIINSEVIHSVKLDTIFRQAEESLIVVNAHRINRGEYPFYNENGKDFFFIRKQAEKDILEVIKNLCIKRLPGYYKDINPANDIQVLTPVKKGLLGSFSLNKELQDVFNPPSPEIREKNFGHKIFREGDKVMQIKNNYELKWKNSTDGSQGEGVFNGDIGFISRIDKDYNTITVVFDGCRYVTYDFIQNDELELAYAVTVHKSQGNEFPIIVMPVSWFPPVLATRNLLYTAITRGKKAVVLAGNEKQMQHMVDNNRITMRYSGLCSCLKMMESETAE